MPSLVFYSICLPLIWNCTWAANCRKKKSRSLCKKQVDKKQVDIQRFICYICVAYVYDTSKAKFVVLAVHIYAQKSFIQPIKLHYHIIHMHLSHQSPHITLFLQLMNTCELCTSVLNLDRLASCCISVLRQKQEPKELTLAHNFLYHDCKSNKTRNRAARGKSRIPGIVNKFQKGITLCISSFDTNDRDTFSKLSFNTSVIAAVIASACFKGTPCPSSLLTYTIHNNKGYKN